MMERTEISNASASKGVDFERDVYCLMGLPIDALDMDGAVQRLRQAAFSNTRCFVSTVNLNFLMAARGDAAFRDSVLHSDLSLADGMPLVWVARLLGLPIRERVSGAGLFERLAQHPGPPIKVFFFGGPDGAAQAACGRINQASGGLRCVGFDSPGFGSVEEMSNADRIERINRSGAQFIVVALGAKKGQAWIERNRAHLQAPVLCHLGAVVNFAAGTVRRAPVWVQALGAEWLWRVKEEPHLWRRYLRDGWLLLRLFFRCVLPYKFDLFCERAIPARGGAAIINVVESAAETSIALSGHLTREHGQVLRAALARSLSRHLPLSVDLGNVANMDARVIGLLMLAYGAFEVDRGFSAVNATPRLARLLQYNCAEFLIKSVRRPFPRH